MGAVSIDLYKKEKEYRHLTLSDENVVKYLIEYRSQLDISYGASTNIDINVAGDIMEFNVEILALYVSLDSLLDRIEMKDKDRIFIRLLFQGHRVGDIISLKEHNFPRRTAYRILDRIVEKVVKMNKEDWGRTMIMTKHKKETMEKCTEKGELDNGLQGDTEKLT